MDTQSSEQWIYEAGNTKKVRDIWLRHILSKSQKRRRHREKMSVPEPCRHTFLCQSCLSESQNLGRKSWLWTPNHSFISLLFEVVIDFFNKPYMVHSIMLTHFSPLFFSPLLNLVLNCLLHYNSRE